MSAKNKSRIKQQKQGKGIEKNGVVGAIWGRLVREVFPVCELGADRGDPCSKMSEVLRQIPGVQNTESGS